MKLLPDEKDWNHLDKKWVCDVLYTMNPEAIQAMIDRALMQRKEKLEHN